MPKLKTDTVFKCTYIYMHSIFLQMFFLANETCITLGCMCSLWTTIKQDLQNAQPFHFFHSALSQDSQNIFYEKRARSNSHLTDGQCFQIVAMVMAWQDLMNLPYIDSWKISDHPKQNMHLFCITCNLLHILSARCAWIRSRSFCQVYIIQALMLYLQRILHINYCI